MRRYGNAWGEFRAWVATHVLGLAMKIHFRATMDMAADLAELERQHHEPQIGDALDRAIDASEHHTEIQRTPGGPAARAHGCTCGGPLAINATCPLH